MTSRTGLFPALTNPKPLDKVHHSGINNDKPKTNVKKPKEAHPAEITEVSSKEPHASCEACSAKKSLGRSQSPTISLNPSYLKRKSDLGFLTGVKTKKITNAMKKTRSIENLAPHEAVPRSILKKVEAKFQETQRHVQFNHQVTDQDSLRAKLNNWLKEKGKTPGSYRNLLKFGANISAKKKRKSLSDVTSQQNTQEHEMMREPSKTRKNLFGNTIPTEVINTNQNYNEINDIVPVMDVTKVPEDYENIKEIAEHIEMMLEECLRLFHGGCSIEFVLQWLCHMEEAIPAVLKFAPYYVCKAKVLSAFPQMLLDVYVQAVRNNAQPCELLANEMKDSLSQWLMSRPMQSTTSQLSTESQECTTPVTLTAAEPPPKPVSVTKGGSTVKYKITTPSLRRITEPVLAVVTPVRRSTRLSSRLSCQQGDVVDDIAEISPTERRSMGGTSVFVQVGLHQRSNYSIDDHLVRCEYKLLTTQNKKSLSHYRTLGLNEDFVDNGISDSAVRSIVKYKKICDKLGILPIRKVYSQLGSSHLTFKHLVLTARDTLALCLVLKDEQQAVSLDFTGNFIGVENIDYVMNVLLYLPQVYQVGLGCNNLKGFAIRKLSKYLVEDNFITRLDLTGNKLNDHDAHTIGEMLKQNRSIRTLLLGHNEFGEDGGKIIGEALAKNNILEDLDLSWNHIRRYGAVCIARGLQANTTVRTVSLSWNGFGFEGSVAVGDMLCKNHFITELDLSCNRIGPPALLELLRGVARNKYLRILKLGLNPITAGFSSIILTVVKKHRESGLQNIDLEGVVVDREFVSLLKDIQKERFFIVKYEVSLPVKKLSQEDMREMIGLPSAYNVDPLKLLYLLKEKMRAADFFYKINKDNDAGLNKKELYSLFDEAGLPVTGSVVDKIMDFMDTNDDGIIDIREFLMGDKKIKNISRKQMRDDQERRAKDVQYTKYSRTFQKAHIDPISYALKIDSSGVLMRQTRRKSSTDKSITDIVANDNDILLLP